MDELIRSLDVPIIRNIESESKWSYEENSDQILEAINYHCQGNFVSEYMRHQLSRMLYQGYLVINDLTFASPIRSVYEVMEQVCKAGISRGILKNISKKVGFDVNHAHFAQSSCITENWVNHARKTKLASQPLSSEVMYKSLISSLSKKNKTGEWVVYSQAGQEIKFWCIWLHEAGDDNLINVINSQCT
ncbi:hypothetical protein H5123_20185 [Shewanella sp. SR43-4]|uniref:hypothetical protein n=1 Tax=Shewanella sp. SR43-4 TaxID=2760942 RepID=UPI0015FB703D|nr:hypothetical protein [Shewanella sp. SR43-4]MBB1319937.1 hypothetical protein [Shewanella sp. SR43-4]